MKRIEVQIQGQDHAVLEFETQGEELQVLRFEVKGCREFLLLSKKWRPLLTGTISKIPTPVGSDHASLLMRELVLRLQDKWGLPYTEEEICHCRIVETKRVTDAIYTGCRSVSAISQRTTAGTSCGSCRPDLESLLDYCLHDKKP